MLVRLALEVGIFTLLITGFITQLVIPYFRDTKFFPLFRGKSVAQRRIAELEQELKEEKAAREADALQQRLNKEFTRRMLGGSDEVGQQAPQEQSATESEELCRERSRKLAERVAFGPKEK